MALAKQDFRKDPQEASGHCPAEEAGKGSAQKLPKYNKESSLSEKDSNLHVPKQLYVRDLSNAGTTQNRRDACMIVHP